MFRPEHEVGTWYWPPVIRSIFLSVAMLKLW
jgi:hypothetical protein